MRVFLEIEVGETRATHLRELLWDDIQLALKSYAFTVIDLQIDKSPPEGEAIPDNRVKGET